MVQSGKHCRAWDHLRYTDLGIIYIYGPGRIFCGTIPESFAVQSWDQLRKAHQGLLSAAVLKSILKPSNLELN